MNSRQIDFIQKNIHESFVDNLSHIENLKNEIIFITGASGFMGSWLLETVNYLNTNHSYNTKIIASAPNMNSIKIKYPHLFNSNMISTINIDVRNPFQIPNEVTYVIHAAGSPDNRIHSSDPLRVIDTIVKGTKNTLEAASLLPNIKKFLNVSSGLIYGSNNKEVPASENDYGSINPASIMSSYTEAKRMAETLCFVYKSQFRLPIINIRPFAFIGPYQSLDRPWAINNFINDSINNNPIKILGNEETVRSYMYPSDMTLWILSFLTSSETNEIYNLGSDEAKTLKEIAQEIQYNVSKNSTLIIPPARISTKSYFVPNITMAISDLKLTQPMNFKDVIKNTINWYKFQN